jgi:hypothetical protein
VSASQLRPAPASRESAHRKRAQAYRLLAEAEEELAVLGSEAGGTSGPRLVSSLREPEELLTIDQAVALLQLGEKSKSTVHRLVRRHPEILRYVGRVRRYEKQTLLRVIRRRGA